MPRTVGSSGPQTRRRILDAASGLFAERGYAGTSMLDIARRLGISKSALYYHFASKDDLLDGMVQPVVESLVEFTRAAESGERSAEQILGTYLDHMINSAPGLYPLMADAGVREAIRLRYDPHLLMGRVESALAALADGPDALVRARFALGGIRTVVLHSMGEVSPVPGGTLLARDGAALLSGGEREAILAAALASLGAGHPSGLAGRLR